MAADEMAPVAVEVVEDPVADEVEAMPEPEPMPAMAMAAPPPVMAPTPEPVLLAQLATPVGAAPEHVEVQPAPDPSGEVDAGAEGPTPPMLAQAVTPTPKPTPKATPDPTPEPVKAVQAQQKVVKRTYKKIKALDRDVEDLALAVKQQRYERLSEFATVHNWQFDTPPPEAANNPEVMSWWSEWRELKLLFEPPEPTK